MARLSTWKLEHPGVTEVLLQKYAFLLAHSSQQFFIYFVLGTRLTFAVIAGILSLKTKTKKRVKYESCRAKQRPHTK
jgi:hypothetical protein